MYDYSAFSAHARRLAATYRFIDLFSVGESVMEKKLYCLRLGRGGKKVCVAAAEKGTEYLESELSMQFLEKYAEAVNCGVPLFGKSARALFCAVSLYLLPMINPDGVDIALHGLDITNPHHRRLISRAGIHSFSRVWQANANGVELGFGGIIKKATLSGEPEAVAVAEFIQAERFSSVVWVRSRQSRAYYDYEAPQYPEGFPYPAAPRDGIQVTVSPERLTDAELDAMSERLAKDVFSEV